MKKLFVIAALVLLAGCYRATVDTGLPLTSLTHSNWAHSFVYGLVPPAAIDGAQQCPGGVARVSTQIGFVHGLLGVLTGGIYTPMQVDVTCAATTAGADLRGSEADVVLTEAIELARHEGRTVIVHFVGE